MRTLILTDALESLDTIDRARALLQILLGRCERRAVLVPALAEGRVVVALHLRVGAVLVALGHHNGHGQVAALLLVLDELFSVLALALALGFFCIID